MDGPPALSPKQNQLPSRITCKILTLFLFPIVEALHSSGGGLLSHVPAVTGDDEGRRRPALGRGLLLPSSFLS
jgi:hypothetical protein